MLFEAIRDQTTIRFLISLKYKTKTMPKVTKKYKNIFRLTVNKKIINAMQKINSVTNI
jgi:hypothetical protein